MILALISNKSFVYIRDLSFVPILKTPVEKSSPVILALISNKSFVYIRDLLFVPIRGEE